MRRRGWRLRPLLLAGAMLGGCGKALPERNSPAAQLYARRCGGCHQVYLPQSMTAGMWQMQVAAMAPKIAAAGKQPLRASEAQEILGYLQRHAGTQ